MSEAASDGPSGRDDRAGVSGGGDGATQIALTGQDADAVGRLRDFAVAHGASRGSDGGSDGGGDGGSDGGGAESGESGECVAVIEHLGRVGARIVAIAAGGEFGDALVSSMEVARIVCERAGLDVREWDRELTARVTPTPADRARMGSRTH